PLRFDARRPSPPVAASQAPPSATAPAAPAAPTFAIDRDAPAIDRDGPAIDRSAPSIDPHPAAIDRAAPPSAAIDPAAPPSAAIDPAAPPSAAIDPAAPSTAAPDPVAPMLEPRATPSAATATPQRDVAAAHEPVTLQRAEDLATAIDRLRPIPRGGATIALQAPGVGTLALTVRIEDGVVHVRITTEDPAAAAWLRDEQAGLRAVAQQAVPDARSVTLELSDSHGDGNRGDAAQHGGHGSRREPTAPAQPSARDAGGAAATRTAEPTATPSRARGLVDVVA
ncbi:MAG: flagellar hook-length control protein FliK, partial [Nannocystaceae bacterium]|nr:flagellar hook-length control protein FliK [Nannocystaceae bacterium]